MTGTGSTVAVIGLGVTGAPMAVGLIDAGYDVAGFNRSPGKVETHAARGGRGASSIAEAAEGPTSCGGSCTCSSRRCHAVGRRERQPRRRAGLASRPQRNPGTPTPREARRRGAYLPEQRPLSA